MTKTIKLTFDTDLPHAALQNVVDHIEDVLISYGIRDYIYESKIKHDEQAPIFCPSCGIYHRPPIHHESAI